MADAAPSMGRVDVTVVFDSRPQFNDWYWRVRTDGDGDYARGRAPSYLAAIDSMQPYLVSLCGEARSSERPGE